MENNIKENAEQVLTTSFKSFLQPRSEFINEMSELIKKSSNNLLVINADQVELDNKVDNIDGLKDNPTRKPKLGK